MSSPPSISASGQTARVPRPDMGYIQPTLGHGLRIWWAYFWRNTAISFVVGATLGFGLGAVSRRVGFVIDRRLYVYAGYAVEYVTAIFIIHFVVGKKFKNFRMILTPAEAADGSRILPPVFSRTFRIWWTFTWRSAVYRVALAVATSVPLGVVGGAAGAISPVFGQGFAWFSGVLISAAVGLFTTYSHILDEDIAGFRVSLAPRGTPVWPEELARIEPVPGAAGSTVS